VIIHDAATTFVAVYDAITLWAELLAAASAFAFIVVVFSTALLIAPGKQGQDEAQQGPGEPHEVSGDSRDATDPDRPADGRTRRRPHWVHTQPLDYDEAA
jgi:hypothetical protein